MKIHPTLPRPSAPLLFGTSSNNADKELLSKHLSTLENALAPNQIQVLKISLSQNPSIRNLYAELKILGQPYSLSTEGQTERIGTPLPDGRTAFTTVDCPDKIDFELRRSDWQVMLKYEAKTREEEYYQYTKTRPNHQELSTKGFPELTQRAKAFFTQLGQLVANQIKPYREKRLTEALERLKNAINPSALEYPPYEYKQQDPVTLQLGESSYNLTKYATTPPSFILKRSDEKVTYTLGTIGANGDFRYENKLKNEDISSKESPLITAQAKEVFNQLDQLIEQRVAERNKSLASVSPPGELEL